jgi:hypothetical protein
MATIALVMIANSKGSDVGLASSRGRTRELGVA